MTQKEYFESCGVGSVKELTDEQVKNYFLQGHAGTESKVSARQALNGAFGLDPMESSEAFNMMRKAMEEGKIIRCVFSEGEGVVEEGVEISCPSLKFSLV